MVIDPDQNKKTLICINKDWTVEQCKQITLEFKLGKAGKSTVLLKFFS